MKVIYKYKIDSDLVHILMPKDAEVLTCQMQDGTPTIWAMVDPKNEKENRVFEMINTGGSIHEINGHERKYINTFQMCNGTLVFHLFELSPIRISLSSIDEKEISNQREKQLL